MSADMNARNWIVLPQLPNRQDWIARLSEAATAAGYVLHDWDENQAFDDAATVLLLTASADEARSRQPDVSRIAAVLDALDIIIPDEMEQAERHRIVHAASQGFAQATTLPPERVFGPDDLAKGPIRLFPDLEVKRPRAQSPVQGPMAAALQFYTQGQAVWPGAVLTWHRPPTHAGGFASLDLTGRPRIIVYGPYFDMPQGRWKAVFTLSVDDYASRYLFRADWGGMEDFASQEFRLQRPGVFEIEMVYDWETPGICEFRLLVMEGVFHGQISLSDLVVSRVD